MYIQGVLSMNQFRLHTTRDKPAVTTKGKIGAILQLSVAEHKHLTSHRPALLCTRQTNLHASEVGHIYA